MATSLGFEGHMKGAEAMPWRLGSSEPLPHVGKASRCSSAARLSPSTTRLRAGRPGHPSGRTRWRRRWPPGHRREPSPQIRSGRGLTV